MKKMFAALLVSAMIVPAIASADALDDATRRQVCGENVKPVAAEYADVDGVRHLKVQCGECTLCGTGLGGGSSAALAGLVILAAASGGDDTSTTTTTTTTTTTGN